MSKTITDRYHCMSWAVFQITLNHLSILFYIICSYKLVIICGVYLIMNPTILIYTEPTKGHLLLFLCNHIRPCHLYFLLPLDHRCPLKSIRPCIIPSCPLLPPFSFIKRGQTRHGLLNYTLTIISSYIILFMVYECIIFRNYI